MSEANKQAAAQEAYKFKTDLDEATAKIKAVAVADNTTGLITIPAGFYYDNAPEGVTEANDRASAAHRDLMLNAQTRATGELAIKAFVDNAGLQTVSSTMPVHKDMSLEVSWGRSGSSRNPSTGDVTNFNGALLARKINEKSTRSQAEVVGIRQTIKAMAVSAGVKD